MNLRRDRFHAAMATLIMSVAIAAVRCDVRGCTDPKEDACQPRCDEGFVCDEQTNRCVTGVLAPYEGAVVPGRGVRVVLVDGRVLFASIDPVEQAIVVGFADEEPLRPRILSRGVRAESHTVRVASGGGVVAVVWLGEDGFYRLATRPVADGATWSIEVVRLAATESASPSYQATQDVDVSLDNEGAASLFFRDRVEGALLRVTPSPEDQMWVREVVDDGGADGADTCPEELRQVRRRGVGHDPFALYAQETSYVAYHDADCGDLRLARRATSGQWLVSVLDRGGAPATERITGVAPSLALDASGRPAISYLDASRGRLMFGAFVNESFAAETVDPGVGFARTSQRPKKIVGAYSTLSFDLGGQPVVTYFDAGEQDLLRARAAVDEAGRRQWRRDVLAEEGIVGFFADHVLTTPLGLFSVAEAIEVGPQGPTSRLVITRQQD